MDSVEKGTPRVTQSSELRETGFFLKSGISDRNLVTAMLVSLAGFCKKQRCLSTEGRVQVTACSPYAYDLTGGEMLRISSLCHCRGNIRMYGSLHS